MTRPNQSDLESARALLRESPLPEHARVADWLGSHIAKQKDKAAIDQICKATGASRTMARAALLLAKRP